MLFSQFKYIRADVWADIQTHSAEYGINHVIANITFSPVGRQ